MTRAIAPSIMSVNAVTTVANAPPMMNATASSTKLPRNMNALKPLKLGLLSEDVGRRGG
jgi:hypothetical protein